MYKIAFTGHRRQKLDDQDKAYIAIRDFILREAEKHKDLVVISGGALGIDTYAASVSRNNNIPFVMVLPFPIKVMSAKWRSADKNVLVELCERAIKTIVIQKEFSFEGYQKRNEYMVDHADLVAAYWNGSKGGTKNCVDYAKSEGKEIVNLFDDDGEDDTPTTKGFITELKENEVFVFGSNLQGFHGAGSAGYAMRGTTKNTWRDDKTFLDILQGRNKDKRGKWAVFGVGEGYQEGMIGKSYAIPTVERPGKQGKVNEEHLYKSIKRFLAFARIHPEFTFKVVKFGANRSEGGFSYFGLETVKGMFKKLSIPENVILPDELVVET